MSVNEPSQLEENVDICFYATSVLDEAFVTKLQSYKFNIIYIGSEHEATVEGIVFIDKIDELIITISSVSKKGFSSLNPLIVGYLMKPSRESDFLKVETFDKHDLGQKIAEANLTFPVLVKPEVACGVVDAHSMEYVDHGANIYKVYAIGNKVFHAIRKSLPNSASLLASGISPITFNSLKNLPVADQAESSVDALDIDLVEAAAQWLRERLGLTIFGFDVVIQENTGDHVIVDLNYLPSFKEVTGVHAISAFWEAIRSTYEIKKIVDVVTHS